LDQPEALAGLRQYFCICHYQNTPDSLPVDETPLEMLMGKAVVLDLPTARTSTTRYGGSRAASAARRSPERRDEPPRDRS
jgi:hypothetical protein